MRTKNTTQLNVNQFEERLTPTVTGHGGYILPHVEVQGVYLGNEYQSTTGLNVARALDQYNASIVNSSYLDVLTQAGYGVGRGTASTGVIVNAQLNPGYYLSDAQIRQYLQNAISSGALQQPDANRLYVVYVEPGIAVSQSGGATSINTFNGYHTAFGGADAYGRSAAIRYAVVVYPGGFNATAASQGLPNNFAFQTEVASHEIAEAVTDPDIGYRAKGWYDDQHNAEIGDLGEGHFAYLNGLRRAVGREQAGPTVGPPRLPSPLRPAGGGPQFAGALGRDLRGPERAPGRGRSVGRRQLGRVRRLKNPSRPFPYT